MTTIAHPQTKYLAAGWEKIYHSAVFSGIIGDAKHRRKGNGTYHLSREDNPPGTYSVIRPDDKGGPDNVASAVDMSMGKADMVLCTRRLMVLYSDLSDPRRKYLNGFNGWLGTRHPTRFDFVRRATERASEDHKAHIHMSIRRRWVTSRVAMDAILSALRGQSKADYLKHAGIAPAKPSPHPSRPSAPPYPGRVLRRTTGAHTDAAVKAWQAQMLARGYKSIGEADGRFDAALEAAVKTAQRHWRVSADGTIGPTTWPLPWTRPRA